MNQAMTHFLSNVRAKIANTPVLGAIARRIWRTLRNAFRCLKYGCQNEARTTALESQLEALQQTLNTKASQADLAKLTRNLLTVQARLDTNAPHALQQGLDPGFYLAFENRFRGDFSAIQARQAIYLPLFASLKTKTPQRPVLDIGSGRGEWLQLLGIHGHVAYGVDSNPAMIDYACALGLDARLADAMQHLSELEDHSLAAITAFHIVEHIPFPALLDFIALALTKLNQGGFIIMETPNPENLLVGACYFYTDPTHSRPLPPDLLAFAAEYQGFTDIELRRLHPFPQFNTDSTSGDQAERFIFGPQDYALIAYKPLES